MRKAILGAVLLAAINSVSYAQGASTELWNGIRSGMTLAQIQSVRPGSQISENGKTVLAGSAEIINTPFDVFVEMSAGRATEVSLVGDGYQATDIRAALTSKYGDPVSKYRCSGSALLRICTEAWAGRSGLKVSLREMTSTKGKALTIDYRTVDVSSL